MDHERLSNRYAWMMRIRHWAIMKNPWSLRDQSLTALGAAAGEDSAPVGGGHAFAESVFPFADDLGWRL